MRREEALRLVKQQITEHRYQHTLGVMETSIMLAERFGADAGKAELAGIFHDYAKFRPKDEMKEIILTQNMNRDLLSYNSELWHAPVGAYLVQKEAGITDPEVLDAIKYHTSGRINMTLLDKCVFLADYIEPGRGFPGVDDVREIAKTDLDQAIIGALRKTIFFLMKKSQAVYPDTFYTYNDLILKKEKVQ
ncbi:bis(5'-nucleosyl)-tetraphosphatase (symmetrical) YqeK [Peribacillus glennii]|uniref:bis(5'-nucleosyl)-tetraphosphatase (symmetrical) n=1 Tax=Peribacillus glennii TaxID=2303991 RepID=A0A372LII2_9BACI|nr:bis(5'-nucleosyl)-tetraphosphatase (symmetrical) YqeK [Peribacillus glennii]RFU65782.1 HD domain-containing protein [Peribacillus glennii]